MPPNYRYPNWECCTLHSRGGTAVRRYTRYGGAVAFSGYMMAGWFMEGRDEGGGGGAACCFNAVKLVCLDACLAYIGFLR